MSNSPAINLPTMPEITSAGDTHLAVYVDGTITRAVGKWPDKFIVDKAPEVLKVKTRINYATLGRYSDPTQLNNIVREKMVKKLFQQLLEKPGVIKITSNVNPDTHAVTFEAELQVLPYV